MLIRSTDYMHARHVLESFAFLSTCGMEGACKRVFGLDS